MTQKSCCCWSDIAHQLSIRACNVKDHAVCIEAQDSCKCYVTYIALSTWVAQVLLMPKAQLVR